MEKGFLKHFTIIGGGTFINMILGIFTTPIITRLVAPGKYGQLSIFTMYSNIALMILCFGLDQALIRFYYEKESITFKRALLFKCVKIPIIVSIMISLGIIVLSKTKIIEFEFNTIIMVFLCLYTIIQLIYRFSLLLVRLSYKSKLYSLLNIIHKLSYIILALPLIVYICNDSLLALIIANVVSSFICMIISLISQSPLWDLIKNQPAECNISQRELLIYAYPYIFSYGITTLFQAIDKISLNKFCTYHEVGIYSSTMTLVSIFAIIQTTFNSLWTPMSVEHFTKNQNDKSFYQKGNQIITVVMFFMGSSLILFKDVFAVLLGEKYREAAYILPFLIFNPIMYTISETTVGGLIFFKKSKVQVIISLGACIANIIGNMMLVPVLGGKGAAISTGISWIIFMTLRTTLSNRYFYIDYKLKKFYTLTFVTVIYALYNTFVDFNIWSIIGYFLVMSVLVLLYCDTIKWCFRYLSDFLCQIVRRLNNGN